MNPRVRPMAFLLCALASAGIACSPPAALGCPDGSWDHDGDAETACVAWTACEPGSYVAEAGSATADRTCGACADGTFSAEPNAGSCSAWTACVPGEFLVRAGSATADRACRACEPGSWDHDADPATACVAWTDCAAGESVAAAGGATTDRTCQACGDGTYSSEVNAAACSGWTVCVPGETLGREGSAAADRVCFACEAGFWDDDGNPATACVAWADCEPGEYVATPGSASSDRACAACDAGHSSTSRNATSCFAVAAAVDASNYGTCAVLGDGRVKCWGWNIFGQLGLGDSENRGDEPGGMGDALAAVDLGSGRTATAVTVGDGHACAVLDDGRVKCWGDGLSGQLGLGDRENRGDGPGEMGDALAAVDLGIGRSATAIAAGGEHTCALLDGGAVKCWGANSDAQLGLGIGTWINRGISPGQMGDALPAVDLGTGRSARAISAGINHTCALLDDGAVKCWGANSRGQLGLGDSERRGEVPAEMGDGLPAVDLGAGRTAKAISAGAWHTCARLDDAGVKCWGLGLDGQLGLGDRENRGDEPGGMGDALPAVALGSGRTAKAIAAGAMHTCALLDDDSVKCWGKNAGGQLGLGDTFARGDEPGEMGDALPAIDLGAGRTATAVVAGYGHSCALLGDGRVKCWGSNAMGASGLGEVRSRGDGLGEMGDALPAVDLGSRP